MKFILEYARFEVKLSGTETGKRNRLNNCNLQ